MRVSNALADRVLWVEGSDDRAVVGSITRRHVGAAPFLVEIAEGEANLLRGLSLRLRRRDLTCMGVVLDADTDADARWHSIRATLLKEGYPEVPRIIVPQGAIIPSVDELPRFGAWIMPDNGNTGMLEDFVASLVPAGDPLWKRAGEAIDGIPEADLRFSRTHRSKAHIHTWLAWQEGPGSPMGQAITKGDLDANAPPAQEFVGWLKRLFVDEPTM